MTLKSMVRTSLCGIGAVYMLAAAPVALAHDSVIGGNVQAGSTFDQFPAEIELEFSAIPKEGFNTFAVSNVDTGEVLFDATPAIEGRNLTVNTPQGLNPGPGHYQVGFQITSSDGHATRGSVPFEVVGTASETSPAVASSQNQQDSPKETSSPGIAQTGGLISIVGAVLVLAAVAAIAWAKMKRN